MNEKNYQKKYLRPGIRVDCSDGKAGVISKIITDPDSQRPTYLAVKMGLLKTREVVAPVSLVKELTLESVRLDISRRELSEFPQYEFTMRVGEYERYQPIGRPRPMEIYRPPARSGQLVLHQRSVPDHNVEVKHGMAVVSVDGDPLGKVEGLILDRQREQGSQVVFRSKRTKQLQIIPVVLVESVDNQAVRLRIDEETAMGLPTYLDELAESLN